MATKHPLDKLVRRWLEKITLANKYKKRKFSDAADTCMKFLEGGAQLSRFMWDNERRWKDSYAGDSNATDVNPPSFRMTLNKAAELVQLFGPSLYQSNPVRTVTATRFSDLDPGTITLSLVGPVPPRPPPPQPPPRPAPPPAPPPPPPPPPGTPPERIQQVRQAWEAQQAQYQQAVAQQQAQYQQAVAQQQAQYQQVVAQQQAQYQQAVAQRVTPLLEQEQQRVALNSARAQIISDYLNYTPNITGLKDSFSMAIDEALVKGASCVWTVLTRGHESAHQVAASVYDTVDNLVLDPDAEVRSDCKFIAQRVAEPYWLVEAEHGFPEGFLKKYRQPSGTGNYVSRAESLSETTKDESQNRKVGIVNDLCVYWKIWSKMGAGDRMAGVEKDDPKLAGSMRMLGDFVYLEVCEGIPFPLNLSDEHLRAPDTSEMDDDATAAAQEQYQNSLFEKVQWPVPFHAANEWPVTLVSFHEVPNQVWPMSHLTPALGELKFLNWAFSFLASKVRTSCGTYVAILKAAGEDLKQQIIEGGDNVVIMLESALGTRISDVVSFLEQPPFHGDIYRVISEMIDIFEKRTGLTELLYGQTSTQSRTAMDVNVKMQNASIRIDDMANKVEESATACARKEAMTARWLLSYEDVLPILGPLRATVWMNLVQTSDFETVVHELDYRIEAGSARRPNKSTRIDQMNNAMGVLVPIFNEWLSMYHDPQPLMWLVGHWARAMDISTDGLNMAPPPPPPPSPAPTPPAPPSGSPPPGAAPRPPQRQTAPHRPAPPARQQTAPRQFPGAASR